MTAITAPGSVDAGGPLFSLVTPVYNAEAFLPAFLDSLTRQSGKLADCELIFVNDGSTDSSASLIREWIARSDCVAELIEQPNLGPSMARNAGLERASGAWVTFPDSDDVLDRTYLHRVREFLASRSVPVDLICTRLLILNDETGEVTDTHPLHRKFDAGTRVVNLERSPDMIQLSAPTAFYRRDRIERLGLRFDELIRPTFEDASFTTHYLIASLAPSIGIVADARYLYRKRSDASSLVQSSWLQADKYTTVMERGYLALIRRLVEDRGHAPVWVQNLVLYDLLFYFRTDQSTDSATGLAQEAWTDVFHALAEEILRYIDVETIDGFSIMPTSRQLKEMLIVGYKGQRRLPTSIALEKLDADQRLVQVRYFFAGTAPDERLYLDGRQALPTYAKTRDITYLNRVLLRERILWLSATAEIDISLNGRRMPLQFGTPPSAMYSAPPSLTWLRLKGIRRPPRAPFQGVPDGGEPPRPASQRLKAAIRKRFPGSVRRLRQFQRSLLGQPSLIARSTSGYETSPFADLDPRHDARIKRGATSWTVRRRYARAWTFMDRDTEAHDNAEHLYRHVRQHHPEINAWFVLRREAKDWDRLAAEGFRLVAFGTVDHAQLLLNTIHVVSSQVDNYVIRPLDPARLGKRAWRFTFLQHGVTKDDLSRWLNSKAIDRFITASPGEHASIVDDHTPYVFTEKEVRLTGFPRHDRLLALHQHVERPSLLVAMPTWRRWLMASATIGNARALRAPLAETVFGRAWFDLIGSDELKAIADDAGLTIAFVPHPNMQAHIGADDLPPWVSVHDYETSDVQDLLARAAVTITDYSSQAFEAAYIECPVVYYQFDQTDFFSGTHVYRKGRWDYESDGFGPVALSGDVAMQAIRDAVARGAPIEPYLGRMRAAFPYRDGRCCERTLESIVALTRPTPADKAFRFVIQEQRQIDAVVSSHGEPEPSTGRDQPRAPSLGAAGQQEGVRPRAASRAAVPKRTSGR